MGHNYQLHAGDLPGEKLAVLRRFMDSKLADVRASMDLAAAEHEALDAIGKAIQSGDIPLGELRKCQGTIRQFRRDQEAFLLRMRELEMLERQLAVATPNEEEPGVDYNPADVLAILAECGIGVKLHDQANTDSSDSGPTGTLYPHQQNVNGGNGHHSS